MIGNTLHTTQHPGGGGEVMLHFGMLYGLGANMILYALLIRARTIVIAFLGLA